MEFFPQKTNIEFMKYRWIFLVFSFCLIAGSIGVWFSTGTKKFSVDFLGGIELLVKYTEKAPIDKVRGALSDAGFANAIVQEFQGEQDEYSVRLKAEVETDTAREVLASLEKVGKFTVLKKDVIGPIIGKEVREAGIFALCLSLLAILIYVSLRFEFRFALGAVLAVFHDAIIATGAYILSGREVDSAMLAGILTIIGYSINDTIVVFDRIRENLHRDEKKGARKGQSGQERLGEIMNKSVNETLSRTILTNFTAWCVSGTLLFFGGGALENLAFVLFVGILVGSYSTIYIASPLVLLFEKRVKK